MTVTMGLYFFAIAFVLAQLEIQIEGAYGWAEKLPTWRWQTPRVLRWAGKPITGYHVFLILFILLFIHLPMMYVGFSLEREAEILSLSCLLAVFWDFLWFVCNPHFGLVRFRRGQVWWFKSWMLGLPAAYFTGLGLSLLVYVGAGCLTGGMTWSERTGRWAIVFAAFLVPTLYSRDDGDAPAVPQGGIGRSRERLTPSPRPVRMFWTSPFPLRAPLAAIAMPDTTAWPRNHSASGARGTISID